MLKTTDFQNSPHASTVRAALTQVLLVLLFSGYATARDKNSQELLGVKVNLKVENRNLAYVLVQIEKQVDIRFTYKTSLLPPEKNITATFQNNPLSEVLDRLFDPVGLHYKLLGKQIVLTRPEAPPAVNPSLLQPPPGVNQPELRIKGRVVDEKGDGMPGVSILIKNTQNGTTTDARGEYTLSVPDGNASLVFSYVGFISQEITVGSKNTIDIALKADEKILDEVVVVGFGTQKKQSVVGSIVQATNEDLKRTGNVTDLRQALTGQLPGVSTITSSGEPGGTTTGESATAIFIRGRNTWNGGQPLVLVDGAERAMSNVDVSEVETISVLKDASATAVFGVKGANGVILITTKRGSESKPQLSVAYNATALSVSKLPEKLDSYEAIMLRNEMIEREGALNPVSWNDYIPHDVALRYKKPQSATDAMLYPNVDWEKAMFKDISWSHRANVNVTGGTKFVRYFGSLAYLKESDMFKSYNNNKGYDPSYAFNRFNFRSNLDIRLTKITNLKVNLSGLFSQKNTSYSYANQSSNTNPLAWAAAYHFPPDVILPQYANGAWGQNYALPPESLQNPVALIYNTGVFQRRNVELKADFALEQKLDFITKGLTYNGTLFYDNGFQTVGGILDGNHVRPEGNLLGMIVYPGRYTGEGQNPGEYTEMTPVVAANAFDWVVNPWSIDGETASTIYRRLVHQHQLAYGRDFGKHNVGAMGMFRREDFASGNMFPSFREDWIFRTTYDYGGRYLFEFNGAYNGSEKFGPGYRFDFFPSVALGWYVSNEKFFKADWISKLKFRYSTGMVGDDSGGARWAYMSQYSYGNSSLLNTNATEYSPYKFYKEAVVGNPDIHWEKARKTNYGLEMGFLRDFATLTFDYFNENRTDIMIDGGSRAIAPYFGATPPSANLGRVKSSGYEIELRLNKRLSNGIALWANLSYTHTQNKIISRDDPELRPRYLKQAGYQIGQIRSQIRTGFYNNWDQVFASVPQQTNDISKLPGYYNITDYNGDGVITANEDAVPFGYSEVPMNNYNATIGGSYKGISLTLQFFAVNNVSRNVTLDNFYLYQNLLFAHTRDYWSQDNPNASSYLPRWKSQGQFIGDYFIYDGSFIRLKTAELAYTFQKPILSRLGLSSLRVFVNGNNLIFWSKLPDDREAAWSGGTASAGAYPTPKRFNLGIELTF